MAAQELLNQLQSLGVSIKARGNDLVVTPASRVPLGLKGEIRDNKIAILALLTPPPPVCSVGTARLLAWAAQAAEMDLTLSVPVRFLETPLRLYTTAEVGLYCRQQLKYLSLARSNRATGGWGRFTPEWWTEMEANSMEALAALKAAISATKIHGEESP